MKWEKYIVPAFLTVMIAVTGWAGNKLQSLEVALTHALGVVEQYHVANVAEHNSFRQIDTILSDRLQYLERNRTR